MRCVAWSTLLTIPFRMRVSVVVSALCRLPLESEDYFSLYLTTLRMRVWPLFIHCILMLTTSIKNLQYM